MAKNVNSGGSKKAKAEVKTEVPKEEVEEIDYSTWTEEQFEEKLSEKQKIFCKEWLKDYNAARAARVAGYSEATAKSIASENLTKPYIKAYIALIRVDTAKLAGISAFRIAEELRKLAFNNVTDFKMDWMTLKNFKDVSDDHKAALSEINYTTRKTIDEEGNEVVEEIVKFKVHDKIKALDMLSKMFGYNEPDKIHHSGNIEIDFED